MRLLLALLLTATTLQSQWDIQTSHTTASLRGIHNVGNGVAWASGTDGTVLRTTDDGATWQTCPTPPAADHLDFRGIQAFDRNTAIVMSSGLGDLSRLYKTTDSCQSWKLVFTNPDKEGFWDAIGFTDESHGFLLGDPINVGEDLGPHIVLKQTFDGGASWTAWEQTVQSLKTGKETAFYAASNSSLLVENKYATILATGGKDGATLLYTSTHGAGICNCNPMPKESEWNNQLQVFRSDGAPFPKTNTAGIFAIAKSRFGTMAVGGDYKNPESSEQTAAYLAKGSLKGWRTPQTPPHGYRSAVAYDPTHKAWIAVGPNGTDLSTDDGKNWRALKPTPNSNESPNADRNWNALSLPFVVGPKGRIGHLRPNALPSPK